ncbi:MAG: hypothetical protein HYU28_07705 [Actinobacteria bacterium]|nr:hypothetical protein [Actinomycetota bacterium]
MRTGRALTAVITALVAGVVPAGSAWADGTADAWTDGQDIGVEAETPGVTNGESSRGAPSRVTCTYVALPPEESATADDMSQSGWGEQRGDGPGAWYRKICTSADGMSSGTVVWLNDGVDPAVLARQAADRVPIPAPTIGMSPSPDDEQVVNLPTWLWLDGAGWQPVSASASAGGVSVSATASPQRVIWDMGNGDRVECDGPGTAYDRSRPAKGQSTDCEYVYRESSARAPDGTFTVTASVLWGVSWTVTGAPGGGSLGPVERSSSVAVRVAEIQAVNR